ncbi:MAG: hypothetical protein Q8R11_04130 [bacterium]|nr:hypothetical protein [bacterium]
MDEGREKLPQSFDLPEAQPVAVAGKNLLPPKIPRRTLLGYGVALGVAGLGLLKLLGRNDKAVKQEIAKQTAQSTETPIPHPDAPNPR